MPKSTSFRGHRLLKGGAKRWAARYCRSTPNLNAGCGTLLLTFAAAENQVMGELTGCWPKLSFLVSGSMNISLPGSPSIARAANVFSTERGDTREVMINLSASERDAIEDMDVKDLRRAIGEALEARRSIAVTRLQLYRLGPYVRSAEHKFDLALTNLCKAKAATKIASTEDAAIRAGWDLVSAVDQMKDRAKQERRDSERFYVDDHIHEPFTFQPQMTVSVSYRWRETDNDDWSHARIIFRHRHAARPLPEAFGDRRKLTARQRETELSEALQREWYYMRDLALFSVRDFFRDGGNGANIPPTFNAVTDRGSLNNLSLKFWT